MANEPGASRFSVVNDTRGGETFDSVEYGRAFFTLFEGAIYLHQVNGSGSGFTDQVRRLELGLGTYQ